MAINCTDADLLELLHITKLKCRVMFLRKRSRSRELGCFAHQVPAKPLKQT